MAADAGSANDQVDTTITAPVESATPAPVETPTPAPPPPPAPPPHDPYLLRQAQDFGIPPEDAAAMTPAELSRSVYLLNKQQMALRQQMAQPQPVAQPRPEEPDFALPAELKTKLGEFDPAIAQAVEFAARAGVDRAKKAEAELAAVRQQVSQQAFVQQVNAAMVNIPAAQRPIVMSELARMEQSGELPPNTPPHIAVPLAQKALLAAFGVQTGAATSPPPPPPPAPTTSARPTNRISGADGSVRPLKDELKELYASKLQEWEDEDATKAQRNGTFRP